MRRLVLHVAIALITCLLGVSAASLWNIASSGRSPEVAIVVRQKSSPTPAFTNEIDEQEIREILGQYDVAQTQHDAAFFGRIEADDFILTLSSGETLTRAEAIADMMATSMDATYTSDEVRVQFYGNTAIVTGRMTATYAGSKSAYSPQWRWIDLFVKRDGRWQIISTTQV
jgi:uncharacterized protein (TIGR02246 family)